MDKMPSLNNSPAFEIMLFLLSWSMFRDTLPGMIILASLCTMNAWLINNPKYYLKWFVIYAFMSYFTYFAHILTWAWEQKVSIDLPFYEVTLGIIIAGEVLIFVELLEKIRGKRIFLLSNIKDFIKKKAVKLLDDRLNHVIVKGSK